MFCLRNNGCFYLLVKSFGEIFNLGESQNRKQQQTGYTNKPSHFYLELKKHKTFTNHRKGILGFIIAFARKDIEVRVKNDGVEGTSLFWAYHKEIPVLHLHQGELAQIMELLVVLGIGLMVAVLIHADKVGIVIGPVGS